jgi:CBS domain-containing protein
MRAREIMTRNPVCCTASDTVQHAAKLMAEHDCGCLPVVDDLQSRTVVGTITDRDIACRCTAEGKGPHTTVQEAMTADPSCCRPDDDVKAVERLMESRQVRRVPIVDEEGCCIGIVAQADLARAEGRGVTDREVGHLVERVSEPMYGRRRASEDRPEAR